MKLFQFLVTCHLLLAMLGAAAQVEGAQRNVVLIVADDHGCDAGCYGNDVVQTPRLDQFAADATLFTHAFCTTASCSPSRSVILTGMHNHANGQYGLQHSYHKFSTFANAASLPIYLRAAGYRTARCGKFHVAPNAVYAFDTVIPGEGRRDMQMAENCREFLSAPDDRPFFLYFCFHDPHRSNAVHPDRPHRPNRFGNEAAGADDLEVTYETDAIKTPPFLPDSLACRAELAEYYQSISRIDGAVGRLLDLLKEQDLYEQTLVIYMSDHGVAMPAAKTTLYEGGMRAPLIVRDPYQTARGVRSQAIVSWVDMAPTILDCAGVFDRQTRKASPE
ncbi:MAG: sulfatase, partial [Planctomycetales bacterium]|nr:sulfatase [Planctomycetales bacterium]